MASSTLKPAGVQPARKGRTEQEKEAGGTGRLKPKFKKGGKAKKKASPDHSKGKGMSKKGMPKNVKKKGGRMKARKGGSC